MYIINYYDGEVKMDELKKWKIDKSEKSAINFIAILLSISCLSVFTTTVVVATYIKQN